MAEMFDFNAERQKRGLPEVGGIQMEEFATNVVRDFEEDPSGRTVVETTGNTFQISSYTEKDLRTMLNEAQVNPGQYSRRFLYDVAKEYLQKRFKTDAQQGGR